MYGGALAAEPEQAVRFLLYFESGTSRLTIESEAQLPEIHRTIAQRQSKDISVIGHTDRVGSDEDNRVLSLERARMVADLLISQGAATEDLEITSHGESNPLIPTPDDTPEPKNRRVEVIVR